MRSKHLRWLPPLAFLGTLALSGVANATVVWTSTFEKGDVSEWSPGTNPTKALAGGTIRKNVVVQGAQVYTGKYACEITVHPDDLFGQYNQDRVDIQHQSTLTAEGKDTWISGHYMMLADAGVRNEFAFWESNVSYTNVMDFWVEPKTGGGTTVNFGVGFLGATKIWTADFTIGKWHQVATHIHWSTNALMGSVDVWFDGKQVVTAYAAKTKADANTLFFQNGLHRKNPANFVDTIYMDDFIEADSFAEAQIAAPIAQQTDGGTGSMAADGGAAGADGQGSTEASAGAGEAGSGGTTSDANDDVTSAVDATGGASGASGSSGSTGAASGAAGTSGSAFSGGSRPSGGCSVSIERAGTMPPAVASVFALLGIALARQRVVAQRRGRRRRAAAKHAVSASAATP